MGLRVLGIIPIAPGHVFQHNLRQMVHQTILVVDDEPMICALLRRAVAAPGIEVVEADSAEAALRTPPPPSGFDLVITDVTLASMDGAELAARLVSADRGHTFLFLSTDAEDELARQCTARIRPSLVLEKPFALPDLLHAVRSLLEPPQPERLTASLRQRAPHACLQQPAGAAFESERLYRRWVDARGTTADLIGRMHVRFATQSVLYDKILNNLGLFFAAYAAGPPA